MIYTEKERSSNKNQLTPGFNSGTIDYNKQNTHKENALDWNYKKKRSVHTNEFRTTWFVKFH